MPIFKNASAWDSLEDDPLRDYHVWWMKVTMRHANALENCLAAATREENVQAFLTANHMLLIQHLGGGHGRYVIPKQKLGAEYVTDFVIGESHSGGFEWQAVELESPKARMFTKAGNPTKELSHAIKQIQDWRAWLVRNQNYAERPFTEQGLGLTDIIPNLPGLILIGRRSDEAAKWKSLRRQMTNDLNIRIQSFDFLVDNGRMQARVWQQLLKRK